MPGYSGDTSGGTEREYGYRRKRLAAMAGSLYRTGQAAVTEIRGSYAQTRTRGFDGDTDSQGMHIPGAFPDAAIMSHGSDQMVLFPSYAKQHIKRDWSEQTAQPQQQQQQQITNNEEYWRREWERNEDEKAIVDVDVRGWIYSPHAAPMNRRNRILVGLARQLSGLPAPRAEQDVPTTQHEDVRERERIAQEAARIERQGQEEKQVAYRGGYSERPEDGITADRSANSVPGSPVSAPRQVSAGVSDLSDAELAVANANLMARIAPFMTNPHVSLPVTLFFYNDDQSQSRTVMTNDAGHFNVRAPLDFVPTHVRVLANENLSAIQQVKITEPRGVSLISDIDDTVKRSNISAGAREIFRNTFVRELADLTVEGVREWYNSLHELGVSFHYCSNSPWQLFPVLATFFRLSGLPPGSLHLRQYSGMLQGIFEPVAERKRGTLQRLMRDFPERRFLLVGDSGEADLEVYTELALAHPGRILAVFIRDVTTPEEPGFFDSGMELRRITSSLKLDDKPRPPKPAPPPAPAPAPVGPTMGTLIDFTEEPEQIKSARKPPPPRPAKPMALRSASSIERQATEEKPPPLPKRPTATETRTPPPPPPPRRRATPGTISPRLFGYRSSNSDVDYEPLPPAATTPPPAIKRAGTRSGGPTPTGSPTLGPVNRKLEMWRRRLTRAHELLDQQGVALYTWRRGQDVSAEAAGIVKQALGK